MTNKLIHGATMDTLITGVIAEADLLKKTITKPEKERLNHVHIRGGLIQKCIYGAMTGDCHNKRSRELLMICAEPYSSNPCEYRAPLGDFNGKGRTAFSYIEYYINIHKASIDKLVAYIKGDLKQLKRSDL